jgi:hypothetical protein
MAQPCSILNWTTIWFMAQFSNGLLPFRLPSFFYNQSKTRHKLVQYLKGFGIWMSSIWMLMIHKRKMSTILLLPKIGLCLENQPFDWRTQIGYLKSGLQWTSDNRTPYLQTYLCLDIKWLTFLFLDHLITRPVTIITSGYQMVTVNIVQCFWIGTTRLCNKDLNTYRTSPVFKWSILEIPGI